METQAPGDAPVLGDVASIITDLPTEGKGHGSTITSTVLPDNAGDNSQERMDDSPSNSRQSESPPLPDVHGGGADGGSVDGGNRSQTTDRTSPSVSSAPVTRGPSQRGHLKRKMTHESSNLTPAPIR
jgi:hypothetical protein